MPPKVPPTTTEDSSRPRILLLALDNDPLFYEMYSGLINELNDIATFDAEWKLQSAVTYLPKTKPAAIIVADPAIVSPDPSLNALRAKLKTYVNGGGTVVLAGLFSKNMPVDQIDPWFSLDWGLPWQRGPYHRDTMYLNSDSRLKPSGIALELPSVLGHTAVFLNNVAKDAAVYLPTPEPDKGKPEDWYTSVAFAKIGKGSLGYVGDVYNAKGTPKVIRAMCGL